MKIENCPICYEELEVVETTPCICCGKDQDKISVLKQGITEQHIHDSFNFATYRAFGKLEVILCDFCPFEFTSFDASFFGFPKEKKMGPENFQFLKIIEKPQIGKDKFCSACYMRSAFITFTLNLRKAIGA